MDLFEAVETTADNHVGGWVQASDGVRLWVDVRGMGRPLVLVHGWTMSSLFWRRQHHLADHFQVITLDLRGHGRSQQTPRGHTVPRYATDVRNVITALHLRDVCLMGWSLGGNIVLQYWAQYGKDRLSHIGLVETSPAPMSSAPWNVHKCRDNDSKAINEDLSSMAEDRAGFANRFVDSMHLAGQAEGHARKWMRKEQMIAPIASASEIYKDYVGRDYTGVLPTITIPSLVVYGRSRHMCYGPSTGRFVAGTLPGAQFVILDKSGHLPFYEQPEAFNDAVTTFLKKQEA